MAVIDDAPLPLPDDELGQFEASAALQRLQIAAHVTRLTEDRAVGSISNDAIDRAKAALLAVTTELDRLKAYGRQHAPLPPELVLRLAEVGLSLESARRLLAKALEPTDTPDE